MMKLFCSVCLAIAATCSLADENGPAFGDEMELAKQTLTDFTRQKTEQGAVYTANAKQLNLKCEGNQRVLLRLGATKGVTSIKIDGKVQAKDPSGDNRYDITKAVTTPDQFPPLVNDFKLELAVKAAQPPAAPEGPVEIAVVFKMGNSD